MEERAKTAVPSRRIWFVGGGLLLLGMVLTPFVKLAFKLLVLQQIGGLLEEMQRDGGSWRLAGMTYDDAGCERIASEVLAGGEDLALWRGGVALVSAGDLAKTFRHNVSGATNVGVFAVDLHGTSRPAVRRVPVEGLPGGPGAVLVGHGLYLSNLTGRLYIVNHGDPKASYIDVFEVHGEGFADVRVRHVDRIGSDLFPYHGINDVVEGRGPGEVFVSLWQVLDSTPEEPAYGAAKTAESFKAYLKQLYLGPGWGSLGVLRCARAAGRWTCVRTEAWGLPSANGMTISPDRRLLLVACPECLQVLRFEISGNVEAGVGRLRQISPPYTLSLGLDNLEWHEGLGQVILVANPVDGNPTGEVLALQAAAGGAPSQPEVLLRHDGSKLKGFSAAVRYNDALLVGSARSEGLLHCRLPPRPSP